MVTLHSSRVASVWPLWSKALHCGKLHALGQAPYLEAQDDGPDEAEGQPVVSIHNVMGAHVLKMDSLLLQELKSLVNILQTVDAHPSLSGFRLETREERWRHFIQKGRGTTLNHTRLSWLVPKPKLKFVCIHLVTESECYCCSPLR